MDDDNAFNPNGPKGQHFRPPPEDEGAGLSTDPNDTQNVSLRVAHDGNAEKSSDFYIDGVVGGDLYTMPAIMTPVPGLFDGVGVSAIGVHWRKVYTVVYPAPKFSGLKDKVLGAYSTEPPGAVFAKGVSGKRLPDGTVVKPRVEAFFLIPDFDGVDVLVETRHFDWDGLKLGQSINTQASRRAIEYSDGKRRPPPLAATKWKIGSSSHREEWTGKDGQDGSRTVYEHSFKLTSLLGEAGGPTRDQYERALDLQRVLSKGDYPPFSTAAVPHLRVVNGDAPAMPWDGPPDADPDDPGATPNDDGSGIPF